MEQAIPEQSGDRYVARIEALVGEIIRHGGFELKFTVQRTEAAGGEEDGAGIVVDFSGPDADLLLEKNAALLDALEYVVLKAVRVDESALRKMVFDCEGWRQVRTEELKLTASIAARQVLETGSPFSLNPMNPRERRIVHLALKDQAGIRTQSEGFGQLRKVVIFPAELSSAN